MEATPVPMDDATDDATLQHWGETLRVADALFDRMIDQQRQKVIRLAREAVPYISSEDVMNPNDFPELKAHPTFDYEDGILAGLISAQMGLRAELKQKLMPPLSASGAAPASAPPVAP